MADPKCLRALIESIDGDGAAGWTVFKASREVIDLRMADLSSRSFINYDLTRADLSGGRLFNTDLTGADLSGATLTYCDMRRVNLADAKLTRANLSGSNIEGGNLVNTNFAEANLTGARLGGAHLVSANLSKANLENAVLRGANLKLAELQGARLKGADVEDADLRNVELSDEVIAGLINLDKAITHAPKSRIRGRGAARQGLPPEEDYSELFREQDCYRILGIKRGASLEDLQKAYRTRVKEYHPDRVAHLGEKLQYVAQREFQRIQHAYRSLGSHLSNPVDNFAPPQTPALAKKDVRELTIEDYIEMIKWEPNVDVLHYNLGVKYLERGLVEMAIAAYLKALELNPRNEHARHNLKIAKLIKTAQG